jgi:hypothetical protein
MFKIVIRHLPLCKFNPVNTIVPIFKIIFKFKLKSVPVFTQVIIRPDTYKFMYFSNPVYCASDPPAFHHPNSMQIFRLFKYFLVNKTNRCTEFQFYCYCNSTCFGQYFCPSSGVLILTSALVHFMQLWWTFGTRSRMALSANSAKTAKNSWWWAESLSETCRVVIPRKLEFSASVCLIHKEYITTHGHTILKFKNFLFISLFTSFFCSVFHLTLLPPSLLITR